MKWKEIVEKFKDEWVLIEVKEVDESYKLKEGDVIAHSKDKSEIYDELLRLKNKSLYIEYTREIPEDLAVVLFGLPLETQTDRISKQAYRCQEKAQLFRLIRKDR